MHLTEPISTAPRVNIDQYSRRCTINYITAKQLVSVYIERMSCCITKTDERFRNAVTYISYMSC